MRRHYAVTLQQASEEAPKLAHLMELARDSSARLHAIRALIPAALHASLQAGPIDGTNWCLIVPHNAAAAKLRQLMPALLAHLRSQGWDVNTIRIKIKER
ncbi:DciA family protein [Extensimonas sp. H3M7-6]|jgi:hypothetical protein|uniref:DciA family protein n=1 Tax=Extensimonas soli TaxID=3031322 RepID=UPI0023DBBBB1|nr:DciA family protein [Extensimonas sp. H3M7-6]MDF1483010.1 DciA family protein [Extensimonas sp. H3M7-6]